ncbi:MAG: hypothetical protein CMK74_01070 [Pseudomonadales bacterium]|jgi:hypothetical protein|nr:hypothetical protein [Pseudomonadales bacterium]
MGDHGPAVEALQRALERLGYPEPRYGVDGALGRLTLDLVDEWAEDADVIGDATPEDVVRVDVLKAITGLGRRKPAQSEAYPLVRDGRPVAAAAYKKRVRHNPISRVDTVVLHQTACRSSGGENWERWKRLSIHYIVTWGEDACAGWLHDADERMPHAQGWNRRSVGIEIEGYFAGIHDAETGEYSKFWRPKSRPDRQPMVPDPMQLEAARQAVKHACERVKALGGQIKYIAAHRQSYGIKASDPGALLWQGVAVPLINEGVVEMYPGGLDHSKHPGKPIPEAWDPERCAGVPY